MTDKNNEFEPADDFDTDLGFEDSGNQGGQKTNKAMYKIIAVAVGLVAVVLAIFMFTGGGGDQGPQSQVSGAPVDPNSLPAQKEPTPEYRQALENYNQQIIEEAKQTGESVVPIPIDPARQQLQTRVEETQEDPAERFRRIQEEYRRQQEMEQQKAEDPAAAENEAKLIETMAQSMSAYLNTALASRQPRGTSTITVNYSPPQDPAAAGGANAASGTAITNPSLADAKVLLAATTIEYGQLLIEANTDAPGPVLAMVASGKFAGSRLLGSFQKTEKFLTINFTQLVTKEGQTIPIQAIVLDPTTTLPGVITEIDHKYFQRYILPAAADFISGVGQAIAETQTSTTQTSSSTTTSNEDPDFSEAISQGISDSFDGLSDALSDSGKSAQPMLRVAAGTPIGILFIQDVLDPDSVREIQDQIAQQQRNSDSLGGTPTGVPALTGFPSMMLPYSMMPFGGVPGTPATGAATPVNIAPTATVPTAAPVANR